MKKREERRLWLTSLLLAYFPLGAYRIESISFEPGALDNVAFRNPDGSIVLLVLNSTSGPTTFNIGWKGKYASYKLGASAVATFRWAGSAEEK